MAKKITEVIAVDLFAGAGGVSTGVLQAAKELGICVKLTAVNHWKTAVNSHAPNHPDVVHICEDVETLHPRNVVPGGHLHALLASCECTFHSNARGGGPCNEQSRSQPWQLIRWMTDLVVDQLVMENVPEWQYWGPVHPCTCGSKNPKKHRKGYNCLRPIKERRSEFFDSFCTAVRGLDYSLDWRIQNCADFGDATKRRRLILMARRDGQPIVWPMPSHGDAETVFNHQREGIAIEPHRTAREHVIDWSLEGKSIFNRKKPLSVNTIRRIEAGLHKFGGPAAEPFLVMLRGLSESHIKTSSTSTDEPLRSVTAGGTHIGLATPIPFVLGQQSGATPRSVDDPIPTVATAGAISLTQATAKPFILPQFSGAKPKSVDQALGAITTDGGPAVVEPVIIQTNHGTAPKPRGTDGRRAHSVNEPIPTVTSCPGFGIATPYLVNMKGQSKAMDIDVPTPTITAHAQHLGVVEPILVHTTHRGTRPAHSVDQPIPTVTAAHRGEMALVDPVIVQTDQTGSNGHCTQTIDGPLKTVVGKQNMGLVQPFVCKFYGTGTAVSLDQPLDTVTTKDRFLLVNPTTNEVMAELDIRFRMLQPHELAAAHSFPKGYIFAGTKGDQTKMIGNSVPVKTAKAHALAALTTVMKSRKVK